MKRLIFAGVFGLLLTASACQTNPLIDPVDEFVNVTVGPEYLYYVETDPKLDASSKEARKMNVEAMRRLILEAQKK